MDKLSTGKISRHDVPSCKGKKAQMSIKRALSSPTKSATKFSNYDVVNHEKISCT